MLVAHQSASSSTRKELGICWSWRWRDAFFAGRRVKIQKNKKNKSRTKALFYSFAVLCLYSVHSNTCFRHCNSVTLQREADRVFAQILLTAKGTTTPCTINSNTSCCCLLPGTSLYGTWYEICTTLYVVHNRIQYTSTMFLCFGWFFDGFYQIDGVHFFARAF